MTFEQFRFFADLAYFFGGGGFGFYLGRDIQRDRNQRQVEDFLRALRRMEEASDEVHQAKLHEIVRHYHTGS